MARAHILKGFPDLESALWVHKHHPGHSIRQMVRLAQENGYEVTQPIRYDIAQILDEWGLADKHTRTLTPKGEAFYSLWQTKRDVAIDMLHGVQYSMWTRKTPDQYLASWAYKTICDYLWNWNALPSHNEELVGYVNRMRRNNQDIIPPDIGAAFSAKSITGAYDWLVPLQPPVLHGVLTQGTVKSFKNATFSRRQTCSTALFVMAVAYISREYGDGGKFVLDDMRKRAICRVCLIEESAFDSTLDETIRKAPQNWDSIR